jgi:hypothetical protein
MLKKLVVVSFPTFGISQMVSFGSPFSFKMLMLVYLAKRLFVLSDFGFPLGRPGLDVGSIFVPFGHTGLHFGYMLVSFVLHFVLARLQSAGSCL